MASRWTTEFTHDEGTIPLKLFRSKESGLLVLTADVPGPILQLFVTFRTEATDNRGLPHTMEHLVFLGSQSFPYKGILDLLAQLSYANGTNAWTAQDHTTYTLSSGSVKGLHVLLPLYLEHLFFPLLRDSHFLTEVHAVNGEGDDVGVVYCEMQAIEQESVNIAYMEMSRLMFPGTNGYGGVETGGMLADLRSPECNMEEIRKYHKSAYRPDNAIVLVCGSALDSDALLACLDETDQRLAASVKALPPMAARPFSRPLDPLLQKESTVEFPSETETYSRLDIGFRVPGPLRDNAELTTELCVLTDYLEDGISSPLYMGLVDLPEPYARSVEFRYDQYAELGFALRLDGVPVARMEEAKERALAILADICRSEKLDLERLRTVLTTSLLNETSELENDAATTIQDNVSLAFLYYDVKKDLVDALFGEKARLERLLKERCNEEAVKSFWIPLLRRHIVEAPRAVVYTRPSVALNEKLQQKDEQLRQERLKQLDVAKLEQELEAAKAEVAAPCPPDVVDAFRERIADSVNEKSFHKLETFRSGRGVPPFEPRPKEWLSAHCHQLGKLPFAMLEVDHYARTEFLDLTIGFDVSAVSSPLFFELWSDMMFALPLKSIPDHVEVDRAMQRDLLEQNCGVGAFGGGRFDPGQWGDIFTITCRARVENYEQAVSWMRRSLFECVPSSDRMLVALNGLMTRLDDAETVQC